MWDTISATSTNKALGQVNGCQQCVTETLPLGSSGAHDVEQGLACLCDDTSTCLGHTQGDKEPPWPQGPFWIETLIPQYGCASVALSGKTWGCGLFISVVMLVSWEWIYFPVSLA